LQGKEDKVRADCDMFVKALTLPGIALPETVNIHFLMSWIPFEKLVTQTFLPSLQFLRRTRPRSAKVYILYIDRKAGCRFAGRAKGLFLLMRAD